MNEAQLKNELKRKDFTPGVRDFHIRYAFWQEYEAAQNGDPHAPRMNMTKIIRRTMTKEAFYRDYVTDMRRLCYMLTPPPDLVAAMEFVIGHSIDRCLEILSQPINNPNGTINFRTVTIMHKTLEVVFDQYMYMTGKGKPKPGQMPKASGGVSKNVEPPPGEPLSAEEQVAQILAEHEAAQREKDQSKIGFEKEPDLSVV